MNDSKTTYVVNDKMKEWLKKLPDYTNDDPDDIRKTADQIIGRLSPVDHEKLVEDLIDTTTCSNRHLHRNGLIVDGDLFALVLRALSIKKAAEGCKP